MSLRGNDVSQELTEIRTVLSRAISAQDRIKQYIEYPHHVDPRYGGNSGFDPDGPQMIAELEHIINRLWKWRKTGRTKRRV